MGGGMLGSLRSERHRRGLVLAITTAGLIALFGSGCAKPSEARPVSTYAGRPADLFNDTIEPAGVGLDFDRSYSPRSDRMLRERAQLGDAILRVRVSTVTAKVDG